MAINIQTVPITPEYPKMISNQQVFVYVDKNMLADKYHYGTALTGTTIASGTATGIPYVYKGDIYINTATGEMYTCTVPGTSVSPDVVAEWQYVMVIKGTEWYNGTVLTGHRDGTPFVQSDSAIAYANVGDLYLNTDTGELYSCTSAGNATIALWKFRAVINGRGFYRGYAEIDGSGHINAMTYDYANFGDTYMCLAFGENRGNLYNCVTPGTPANAVWNYVGNTSVIDHNYDKVASTINITAQPFSQYTFTKPTYSIKITLPALADLFNGYVSEVDFITNSFTPSLTIVSSGYSVKYMVRGTLVNSYTPPSNTTVNMMFRYNGTDMLCVVLEL